MVKVLPVRSSTCFCLYRQHLGSVSLLSWEQRFATASASVDWGSHIQYLQFHTITYLTIPGSVAQPLLIVLTLASTSNIYLTPEGLTTWMYSERTEYSCLCT